MGDTEMDIKYLFVLMAGIVISVAAIVVFVLSRHKKEKYNGGLRSYGMAFIKDNEYLKKRKRLYKAISTGVFVTLVLANVVDVFVNFISDNDYAFVFSQYFSQSL